MDANYISKASQVAFPLPSQQKRQQEEPPPSGSLIRSLDDEASSGGRVDGELLVEVEGALGDVLLVVLLEGEEVGPQCEEAVPGGLAVLELLLKVEVDAAPLGPGPRAHRADAHDQVREERVHLRKRRQRHLRPLVVLPARKEVAHGGNQRAHHVQLEELLALEHRPDQVHEHALVLERQDVLHRLPEVARVAPDAPDRPHLAQARREDLPHD
mmetsp:Transcript_10675/g.26791  ORF Transcript_10675/g.26791 Transcript_10675/m.26791 type:complete len:213 (-) Transcript_10675:283-921(-)